VKVLIAGIGNVFFGDDGFGSVVARSLAGTSLPEGVVVRDFGIRGLDLAYELTSGYDAAILVDAAGRGGEPGELFVLEPRPSLDSEPSSIDAHALTPEAVLRTARSLGGKLPLLRLVGCEPAMLGSEDEPADGLSPLVSAAVPRALCLIDELIAELMDTAPGRLVANHA
jgi:hydrogenase maturation protease